MLIKVVQIAAPSSPKCPLLIHKNIAPVIESDDYWSRQTREMGKYPARLWKQGKNKKKDGKKKKENDVKY